MILSKPQIILSVCILFLNTHLLGMECKKSDIEIIKEIEKMVKNKEISKILAYEKAIQNTQTHEIFKLEFYHEISQLIIKQNIYKALEFIKTYSSILKSKKSNNFFKERLEEIIKCLELAPAHSKYIYCLINDIVSKNKYFKINNKHFQCIKENRQKKYIKKKGHTKHLTNLTRIVKFLKAYKTYKSDGSERLITIPTTEDNPPRVRWVSHPLIIETIKEKIRNLHKEDINIPITNGKRLIHYIASIMPDDIPILLKKGADPNLKDYKGLIPVHIIIFYLINKPHKKIYRPDCKNYMSILGQLLEKTDPNIKIKAIRHTNLSFECRYKNMVGKTLWQIAMPYPEIMDLLIKKCDPNQHDKQTGLAALHQIISYQDCCSKQKIAVIKKILKSNAKKANLNLPDKTLLFTPLHYAVINQEIEITKLLVSHKAKKNEKSIFQETPKKILERLHKNKLIEEEICKKFFQVIK